MSNDQRNKNLFFSHSDNLMEVAEKFCRREGYSKTYLQRIIEFLKQNTKQAKKPAQSQTAAMTTQQNQQFEYIPYTNYIFFEQMNIAGLKKKVEEVTASSFTIFTVQ